MPPRVFTGFFLSNATRITSLSYATRIGKSRAVMTPSPNADIFMDGPSLETQTTLSLDELRFKARYIRDIIAPVLVSAPDEELAPYRLQNLRDIFAAIEATPFTIHDLEYSRIDKALFE